VSYGVGIDFGTSNSTAAVYDGLRVHLVPLEGPDPIMPSATYIDRDLQTLTGQAAIDRYIQDNTGRTVELIPEIIGETSAFVEHGDSENPAPVETVTKKIYGQPLIDSGLHGRLFRGTKRLLGDPRVRRLMVFGHPFRLVALITPLLLRIRKALETQIGPVSEGHLGHPVNFEGRDAFRNTTALQRLAEAYKYAGVRTAHFYPEPIAAAVSYLTAHPDVGGQYLLTLDFGGGTLDFCVLQRERGRFNVITTHGIALGGDHIDQQLFRVLLFPLLGKGESWRKILLYSGIITAAIPIILYLIPFGLLFSTVHSVFFAPGTWVFPKDAVLLQVYPIGFWKSAAFSLFLRGFVTGWLLILAGFIVGKRK